MNDLNARTSRRRSAGVGGLAAILAFAGAVGAATPAQAALPVSGGDIRVKPAAADQPYMQPIEYVKPGATSSVADMQVMFSNTFASGDRILVQLFNNTNVNCTNAASSLGFTAVPDVAVARLVPATSTTSNLPDFAATLISSSTACEALGVKDAVALTLKNTSAGTAADTFMVTLAKNSIAVGSSVSGPIHAAPVGKNGIAGQVPPAWNPSAGTFAGNDTSIAPAVINQWTNPALVQPVEIVTAGPAQLVNDGTYQNIGDVTIKELVPAAFGSAVGDTVVITLSSGQFDTMAPAPAAIPGATVSVTPSTITVTSTTAWSASALNTLVLKGLRVMPTVAGPIDLVFPASNNTALMNPDDDAPYVYGAVNQDADASSVDVKGITVKLTSGINLANRVGGNDRYETAAKIAANMGCTGYAVLASGENFPDALSANYLAGRLDDVRARDGQGVPVLLTKKDSLPAATAVALRNLGVEHVYIVGGPGAVSDAVKAQLENTRVADCGGRGYDSLDKLEVVRIGGADRYETNRLVNQAATHIFYDWSNIARISLEQGKAAKVTAIVASGENASGGADALSVGPLAYRMFPLVLTPASGINASVKQNLDDLNVTQALIAGGTGAVSDSVKSGMAAMGVETAIRWAGADRYDTSAMVAKFATGTTAWVDGKLGGLGWSKRLTLLARGDLFPDALAGGAFGGSGVWDWDEYHSPMPILLTRPTTLPAPTKAYLEGIASPSNDVVALGLTGSVSNAVLQAAQNAANGS